MPKESKKAGGPPEFGPETKQVPDQDISVDKLASHLSEGVSVSLRYYASNCECFSKWQGPELKKFSGALSKLAGYSADHLKGYKPLCVPHKGGPSEGRFRRPDAISEDLPFWEIKVDPSNKARVHGFFVENVFFLVWLDRKHACFKQ